MTDIGILDSNSESDKHDNDDNGKREITPRMSQYIGLFILKSKRMRNSFSK